MTVKNTPNLYTSHGGSANTLQKMGKTPIFRNDVQLSMRSLNSQEQLEAKALRDLIDVSESRTVLCKGDAITDSGKRRQLLKMLALTITPLVVLLGVSFYFLAESFLDRHEVNSVKVFVEVSIEIGRSVYVLHRERDESALYLSKIGPDTKLYLFTRYFETDQELDNLSSWPQNLDLEKRPQFRNLAAFKAYMTNHRNSLDIVLPTVSEEIDFYTMNIQIFINWLYKAITESKFGTIWKTLVAYQKVVGGKEEVGIERALGSAFFYNQGFQSRDRYLDFNRRSNTFAYAYRSAQNYSPIVQPVEILEKRKKGATNLTQNVFYYRDIIRDRNISEVSVRDATLYYDNMTIYIDILLSVQRSLADQIISKLDNISQEVIGNIILSVVLILVVLGLTPIQILTVYKQTSDIQSYALTLAHKTRQLNQEKRRTDSLLYQMMPRPVADNLKNKKDVNAEYFKDVTIFFSDIDGFASLSARCSPMQIVGLLKELYSSFDCIIEMFDVYKVETIGDQYMVASGVPVKNGKRHASEIAGMALEFLDRATTLIPQSMPGVNIRLRIGVHSGAVMAGVVGTKQPRYCLFGDTVNTASRMSSNGMPNMVHISSSTHKILCKYANCTFRCRGPIDIKGKGQMITYWLTGQTDGKRVAKKSIAESQGAKCDMSKSTIIDVKPMSETVVTHMTSTSETQERLYEPSTSFFVRNAHKLREIQGVAKGDRESVVERADVQELEINYSTDARTISTHTRASVPPAYDELQAAWDKAGASTLPTVQEPHEYLN